MTDQAEDVISWREVGEHAPVIAGDGKEIGKVVDVAALDSEDIFHGVVFKPSGVGLKHYLIPAADIDRITTRAVYVKPGSADVARYEEFQPLHIQRVGLRGIFGWKHYNWTDSSE